MRCGADVCYAFAFYGAEEIAAVEKRSFEFWGRGTRIGGHWRWFVDARIGANQFTYRMYKIMAVAASPENEVRVQ